MTTTTLEKPIADTDPADRYYYGWRYVTRELPDGGATIEQVPLTLEDTLYPEEGDFVVHSKAHEDTCTYLANVFSARLSGDPTAAVLNDVRVAWDVPELRPNGPDIAVVRGVREQRNWSTFDVAAEGVRPELIIEITSPETRANDLIAKVEIYALARVPRYIIANTRLWDGRETLYLIGYQLTPRGYEALAPDEQGRFWLDPVEVWIGIRDNRVTCFDADGEPIDDYPALDAARMEAEGRAHAAEARAQAAEAHAQAESHARMEAESRLRELEAELRKLRGAG